LPINAPRLPRSSIEGADRLKGIGVSISTKRRDFDERKIAFLRPCDLRLNPRNARVHPPRQIDQIARSIERFGFNTPVLVDRQNNLLAGEGRVKAARQLGLERIPALRIEHLTPAEKRAFVLADNKLAEGSGWSRDILTLELQELANLDFNLELTGFNPGEIEALLAGQDPAEEEADEICPEYESSHAVTQLGDRWSAGPHLLLCGDARDHGSYKRLMAGEKATYAVTDPPYNIKIDGNAAGHGRTHYREFALASGEMSQAEFTSFLSDVFQNIRHHTVQGAICAAFIDWRHMPEMLDAGHKNFFELKNLCVWVKPSGGLGSFYRSRHELIFLWKCSRGKHVNNFELGQHGRVRTNVWEHTAGRFNSARAQGHHPTPKPVGLIADAIRDCSRRGDLILDPFCGSGTILMAAERAGRAARAIEIDPCYCDLAIRRWQARTGDSAMHTDTGASFADCESEMLHPKDSEARRERKGQRRR
jgi:DNA modification methylase